MELERLRARGVNVAKPATEHQMNKLRAAVSADIFATLWENIYRKFNGFDDGDFDEATFLRIWPIEKILTSNLLNKNVVPFMDFSLNSDIYVAISGRVPHIFSYESKNMSSIKIDELIRAITSGRLDDSLGL